MATTAPSRSLAFNTPAPGDARDHLNAGLSSGSGPLAGFSPLAIIRGQAKARGQGFSDLSMRASFVLGDLNSGTAALTRVAAAATQATILRLGSGASTNDYGAQAQLSSDGGTTKILPIIAASGIVSVIGGRIKTNVASAAGFLVGFADADTAALSSGSAINLSDFVGYYKAPGGTALAATVRTSSTSTSSTRDASFAADTWREFAVVIDERANVTFWLDGAISLVQTTVSNLPANTVAMTPTFAVANGTSPGAETLLDFDELYWFTQAKAS